ncbi:hypothetical protein V6N11_002140 [Hibiscus sabdariffa]|uniref:Uncharacterized protein n=1 Tax=Hibiscus sabdariffa TaxID=183260 RepID=A0ABR2QUG4_9ROSI
MANTNTSARYTMVAAKNRWEEQGFYFDDSLPNYGLEQFLYNRLNELGWRVPATAATINAILDLSDAEPSFYAMLGGFEEEDFELIKDYLCEENTAWNTTGRNPHSVSRLSLRLEAKLLEHFCQAQPHAHVPQSDCRSNKAAADPHHPHRLPNQHRGDPSQGVGCCLC